MQHLNHMTHDLGDALRKVFEHRAGSVWIFRKLRAYDAMSRDFAYALTELAKLGGFTHQSLLDEATAICDDERSPEIFFALGYDQAHRASDKRRVPLFLMPKQYAAWAKGVEAGEQDIRCPWGKSREFRRAAAIVSFRNAQALARTEFEDSAMGAQ